MKSASIVVTVIVVCVSSFLVAADKKPGKVARKPDGLKRAFINGEGPGWKALSLADFANVNCAEKTWTEKGGTIYCTGKPVGVTKSKKSYKNLELVVEWRHMKPAGNSGVFLWAVEKSFAGLSPVLEFTPERIGKRLVFPFRMADGRQGESLQGLLRFWVYHASADDRLKIDINGQPLEPVKVKQAPAGKRRGGLPGQRYEIDLQDCPRFRGDNTLGLVLENARKRKTNPYMEELEVNVTRSTPRARLTARSGQKKIYIAVDSEGPTGVAEYWARNLKPDSPRLKHFRELLTRDVNAAVTGCFEAGATEVVVKDDGFRDRNVLRNLLDKRVRLVPSGGPLLYGLDSTFAGVMLVGFHAREGATDAVLAHTWSSARRRRYWFNGREGGELAAYAIVAGHDHRVPIIMATGCDGLCREARDWLGKDLVAVSVKRLRADGKVELDPGEETWPRITAGARKAVGQLKRCRPFQVRFPLHVRLQLKSPAVTSGYVQWREQNKPDWPGNRTGPRTLEAYLKSTRHMVF